MLDSCTVFDPGFRVTDANGDPVSGAKLKFYTSGTTTPKTVYSDSALSVSLGSTVTCDSGGYPTSDGSTKTLIWTGTASYKVIITDSSDVTIATHDGITGAIDSGTIGGSGSGVFETPVDTIGGPDQTLASTYRGKLVNLNPTGGNFTVTLESAITAGDGTRYGFRHSGTSGQAKIASVLGQTFYFPGGSTTVGFALSEPGEVAWLVSDGANWTVDLLTRPFGRGEIIPVVSRLTAEPSSPTPGAVYMVSGTPTGTWLAASHAANDLLKADGQGGWIRYRPSADCGWIAYVQGEDLNYQYQSSSWVAWSNITAPTVSTLREIIVGEVQTSGTAGGTITGAAWNARPLNTTLVNTLTTANGANGDASLTSNQIVLPSGTFDVWAWGMMAGTRNSRTRLRAISPVSTVTATSTTSLLIAVASKAFTVASGLSITVGDRYRAESAANTANYMEGHVTAYSSTTLTIQVDAIGGSGTLADWNIKFVPCLLSQSAFAGNSGTDTITYAANTFISERVTLTETSTTFAYEAYGSTTFSTSGMGQANAITGLPEIFSRVRVLDVSSLQGPTGATGTQGNTGRDAGVGRWTFSTTTTSGAASGTFRFNNATIASATALYINETDADSNSLASTIQSWDDSTSTTKGFLTFRKQNTPGTWAQFAVTGSITDNGSDDTVTISYVTGNGSFSASDSVLVSFSRTGDAGAAGSNGSNGSNGATGATGASGPVAIDYTWDTSTTAADPGSGKIRASTGTFSGSFNLYMNETDRLGNGLATFIQSWDDSTSTTTKGVLEIIDLTTPANRVFLSINGSITDNGTYDTIPVAYKSGVTSFSAVNVALLFSPAGDKGADGAGTGDVSSSSNFTADNRLVRTDRPTSDNKNVQQSGITIDDSNNVSGVGTLASGAQTITSASSTALAVGANGTTNPVLQVDAATASVATGIKITGAAAASRVAFAATSSGTDEGLSIDAKGAGTIRLGATSTGAVEFSRNAVPTASDGAALGTTTLMWSDLFLATGGVINWNNGNVTLTHSAGNLTLAGASNLLMGTSIAVQLGTIELGAANDTTVSRSAAGRLAVEGKDALLKGQTDTLTTGFTFTPNNIGTVTSGTTTPDPALGNYQYLTWNVTTSATIAVPASDCAIDILWTNNATGTLVGPTMSGSYTAPSGGGGDTFATTNSNKYILMIRRINGVSTYAWKALQ